MNACLHKNGERYLHPPHPTTFDLRAGLWSLQPDVIKVRWARSVSEPWHSPRTARRANKLAPDVRTSSLTGQTGWHGTASNTKYYPLWATGLKLPAASGLLLGETLHTAHTQRDCSPNIICSVCNISFNKQQYRWYIVWQLNVLNLKFVRLY